ncbi:ABC transporter permease [Halomonas maura]|uniref:ABC transporter permease n=1 Tax=Halomonas maura TaxID=117606 RepID=UPI0025B61C18|nr:ABC transporter permease [Halomonas maura]MDN3557478.1 ABC transporter permease [Halomonas maura]
MPEANSSNGGVRTPWQVARSVWFAMFMRETISRTMADRFAWFWMIFEPVAFVGIFIAIRTMIRGDRFVIGADFIPWLIVGLMGFFLFREGMNRPVGAIEANQGLFAYRQVLPIDPVLVRIVLEGLLRTFIFLIFIVGGIMLGLDLYADLPMFAMWAWLSLWALGAGAGLTISAAAALVPEIGRVVKMISLPLMLISGVIIPMSLKSYHLQQLMLYNPIAHAIEFLRLGFFENYKTVSGISMLYVWMFALALIALGMILHLRFAEELKAK